MRRERTIWIGFTVLVILAVMVVLGRDDDRKDDRSRLSAGTSAPTSIRRPPTTPTTLGPTTTSSSSTSTPASSTSTTPATTRQPTATAATTPDTVATTPPTAPPTTSPPTTPAPLRVQFGPGTFRIGVDLPAGTYRTEGGDFCFWARLSSLSGAPDSVIASQHTNGSAATVVIDPADAGFGTSGCAPWLSI